MTDVRTETVIAAPPEVVYTAFTFPNQIAHWLCETARLQVRAGGAFTLMWYKGSWAAGVYTAVEPNARIAFTWNEPGAAGETQVDVTLTPDGDRTRVVLVASGFGEGPAWDGFREDMARFWPEQLDNLKTLLETASDARLLRRPAVAAGLIPLPADEAAAKGLPVPYALNLTVVFDGGAADRAGLRAGDYVTLLDGDPMTGFPDFNAVMSRHTAGDTIPVEYYRDGRRATTELTLDQRQSHHLPDTREELYEKVRQQVAEIEAELDAIFAGVPEPALTLRPAPHEWSAKEVLAHLIWTERWTQQAEWLMITAGTPIDWGNNNDFEIGGIVRTRETAGELLAELKRMLREQLENVPHIPDQTMSIKPLYAELAAWLCATGEHCREHYDQLKAAIAHAQAVIPA